MMNVSRILIVLVAWGLPGFVSAQPIITEFLANPNSMTLADEEGDTTDWIEIHNPDASELPLGGYFLTDDPAHTDRWMIPAGTVVPAGGYLVIFASDKMKIDPMQNLHTDFKLSSRGDYLALLGTDGTTVLTQYTWDENPAHTSGVSFGKLGDPAEDQFMESPTPGEANTGPIFNPGKVLFSHESMTFEDSFSVTLMPEIEGMEIRYTTDRSEPTETSTLYEAPILIENSTMLRARLVGAATGSVSARNYIELSTASIPVDLEAGATTLSGFSSNLPVVVIDTFGGAAATTGDPRPTTVSVFESVDGVTSLSSTPTISSRAAFRIRGASSSGFPKKQYRVEIRNQEDEDKDVSFIGLPADSDWVFGAPYTDKALIRNALVFDLGREIGLSAPRTRHVEVFINQNGGPLNYATDYKGVYLITESLKISNDRLDIAELAPSDIAEPEITGGYLMSWENGASESAKRMPGWNHLEMRDPDPETQATLAQKQWISSYVQDAETATKSAEYTDPVNGYAPFFDLPSYYNLFAINELTRDQDAYMRSAYFHKDRSGPLVMGPLWDYNLTMGTGCCRNNWYAIPEVSGDSGWQYIENDGNSETNWETRLVTDPNFWQGFVDRWQALRENELSDQQLHARMDVQADPLSEAAVRNFAVWDNLDQSQVGFPTPVTDTWEEQVEFMKNWTADRMMWIDSNMTPPPVLTPESSEVLGGTDAMLSGIEGTVYYTTDGSDPRLPGGGIRDGALSYATVGLVDVDILAESSQGWKYLDDGSDQGGSDIVEGHPSYSTSNWKHPDFDDSAWAEGQAPLGYESASSEDQLNTLIAYGPDDRDRHMTSYFRKTFTVGGTESFVGILMEAMFDDGLILYLNGKELQRLNMPTGVVGFDDRASRSRGGSTERGWDPIALRMEQLLLGENVITAEVHQSTGTSNDLRIDIRLKGLEIGGTPEMIPLTETTVVTARALDGENWSRMERSIYVVDGAAAASNLVISEIHYNPLDPTPTEEGQGYTSKDDFEFMELLNVGTEEIDLSGVHFTAGIDFDFAQGTKLAADGRLLLVRNEAAFTFRYPAVAAANIIGEFQNMTGLGNDNDTITLNAVDGSVIQTMHYLDHAPWPLAADGDGASLVLILPYTRPDHALSSSWRASTVQNGTPDDSDGTTFGGGSPDQLLAYATNGVIPKAWSGADGKVNFSVGLNILADDLSMHIETSTDLVNWEAADAAFENSSMLLQPGNQATVNFSSVAPASEGMLFIRHSVTQSVD